MFDYPTYTPRLFSACLLGLLTAAAHGQSSVTVYGFVDMGISKANAGTTPGASLNGRGPADVWSVQQGNGSRLGFQGKEDLGNGGYARFQLETRFFPDTGAQQAAVFWGGRTAVALGKAELGEVYMGREFTPAFWVACAVDPTCWSYVSQLGNAYTWGNWNGGATNGMDASTIRWSNAVGYKAPVWKGLNLEAQTSVGEGNRRRSLSFAAQYKADGIYLGAGYDGTDRANNLKILGIGYDFGVVSLKASRTMVKGGLNGDSKAAAFTAQVPLSTGRLFFTTGYLDPINSGNNSKMVGAGYEYNLSKRTLLYTNVASAKKNGFTRTTAFDLGAKVSF